MKKFRHETYKGLKKHKTTFKLQYVAIKGSYENLLSRKRSIMCTSFAPRRSKNVLRLKAEEKISFELFLGTPVSPVLL